jgi:hypothetical protein
MVETAAGVKAVVLLNLSVIEILCLQITVLPAARAAWSASSTRSFFSDFDLGRAPYPKHSHATGELRRFASRSCSFSRS